MAAQAHLVDAHCHGVYPGELGLGAFEARLPGTAAPGTTLFDSPSGFALRRWCPPLLGLEPHCPPARYLARRRELGAYESARRLLRGAGIRAYVLDTGEPGDLTPPKDLAATAGAPVVETVRLEPLAQQVADTSGTVGSFLANLAEAVHGAALGAAGFSCAGDDAARHGGDARPPGPVEVRQAAVAWLSARAVGERPDHPVLLRHLRWHAVATGLPLLLRYRPAGEGPAAAGDFLRATAGLGAEVVLLPAEPHEAAAADLAAALPHVYVGVGRDPAGVLGRTPFGKVLYASGVSGLPELAVSAAKGFLAELRRTVAERVRAGEWSAADGRHVTSLVAADNALRVFRLAEGGARSAGGGARSAAPAGPADCGPAPRGPISCGPASCGPVRPSAR
ncbi:amidohydrolase [Actinacidiphila reveromycinica]|uniref:amidohydrolase n=1 Tax=Actinacidiphila reveromycinica TaxID=659352 RepID=UPI003D29D77A